MVLIAVAMLLMVLLLTLSDGMVVIMKEVLAGHLII